jgi:hypothetical protein
MLEKQNKTPPKPSVKPVAKPGPKPNTQRKSTPSEKLANLLRKEALLAAKVTKAQADLKAVQVEIKAAWNERERLNKGILTEAEKES